MGVEADLLLELGEENVIKKEDGKEETEKKDDGEEVMAKIANGDKHCNDETENVMKKVDGKEEKPREKKDEIVPNGEKECNKDEAEDLQLCDKPLCQSPANKKCSRCIFIIFN